MNKKGFTTQIMVLIIMGIVIFFLIALLFIAQLVFPPVMSSIEEIGGVLTEAMEDTGNPDLINASASSFDPAIESTNNLEWVIFTISIFLFIVFIIMCFYVRTYPFLLFVWIIMIIILLFAAIFLTVAYQDIIASSSGGYYTAWENTHFLVQNLPILVLAMGIVGGIIMFILASREQEAEQIGVNVGI